MIMTHRKEILKGNVFINLETLGDLRQIFLPSLIFNVFFIVQQSKNIVFEKYSLRNLFKKSNK